MMPDNTPTYGISQEMEITRPEKARAFPITYREWELIKSSIAAIDDSNSMFHTIGSILLGAATSTFVTVLLSDAEKTPAKQFVILVSITVGCFVCGSLSMLFARLQKDIVRKSASNVLEQMNLIEERFPKKE